ncbi:hypothetical protein [Dyella sp. 20L07]|uniref:hypothetical protein n=1 Tax=Dyella sp. 20L07 TaxID=3384240 RepID=UPI003D26E355
MARDIGKSSAPTWSQDYEQNKLTPKGGSGSVPLLAWLYWESGDQDPPDRNFDTNIAKPAYSDLLLASAIMPPI